MNFRKEMEDFFPRHGFESSQITIPTNDVVEKFKAKHAKEYSRNYDSFMSDYGFICFYNGNDNHGSTEEIHNSPHSLIGFVLTVIGRASYYEEDDSECNKVRKALNVRRKVINENYSVSWFRSEDERPKKLYCNRKIYYTWDYKNPFTRLYWSSEANDWLTGEEIWETRTRSWPTQHYYNGNFRLGFYLISLISYETNDVELRDTLANNSRDYDYTKGWWAEIPKVCSAQSEELLSIWERKWDEYKLGLYDPGYFEMYDFMKKVRSLSELEELLNSGKSLFNSLLK